MYYKAIFLDLDDTLYSYEECHNYAIRSLSEYLNYNVEEIYNICRSQTKNTTNGSCNRILYFKRIAETLNLSDCDALKLNTIYWDMFLKHIKPYSGVIDFLRWNKELGIKLVIITNFQTEHQLKKIKALGIEEYIDIVITSEEVNSCKPDSKIFLTALHKVQLKPHEVMMIGNDYESDICGAQNIGIQLCILFPGSESVTRSVLYCMNPVSPWENFLTTLRSHYDSLSDLLGMSKLFGERVDLVQAGGGNISVKFSDIKLTAIKSSGISLSSMTIKSGYCVVDKEQKIYGGTGRPSIETTMHQIIDHPYVVHLHPIITNCIQSFDVLSTLFPKSLILPYVKPGVELTNMLKKKLRPDHDVIFLQNHGIIVYGNSKSDIIQKVGEICAVCESYAKMDLSQYKEANVVSEIMRKYDSDLVSYRICEMNPYVPATPDCVVYCGAEIPNETNISQYILDYGVLPSLIKYNGSLYSVANSLNRCRDIEIVYLSNSLLNIAPLNTETIKDLLSWEAEKYRKSV